MLLTSRPLGTLLVQYRVPLILSPKQHWRQFLSLELQSQIRLEKTVQLDSRETVRIQWGHSEGSTEIRKQGHHEVQGRHVKCEQHRHAGKGYAEPTQTQL